VAPEVLVVKTDGWKRVDRDILIQQEKINPYPANVENMVRS
jgi:hypothetical protein